MSLMESFLWVCAKESGSPRAWGAEKEAAPQSTWSLGSQVPCVLIGVHGEAAFASHQARLSSDTYSHVAWFVPPVL